MLFNSLSFALFFPAVFLLYWHVFNKNVKFQNLFLLMASYFFYAWWNWRFLSLIILCSLTNYLGGLLLMRIEQQNKRKKILLACCLISLGVLGLFKYYNFFVASFMEAFALLGLHIDIRLLNLILPVGISFYTFHTLSYTIDVYRRKFEPTSDVISFFLFVSIFPLAMAGPIERASNLLPQIYKPRNFNYIQAVDGLRQILWGLFKKMVVADNIAPIVNQIFENSDSMTSNRLLLGAIFYSFQIYGDFSGYSDMALGIGKLLGFKFLRNFNNPYFSRDIAEFWRRWHMSLTTWFRDYLYIPLGGSRGSKWLITRNTFIIFLVSGFWHGANWTFIIWGAFHAFLFLPLILTNKNRKYTTTIAEGKLFPHWKECFQLFLTFLLVTMGWIIFRAENFTHAINYISNMFSPSNFSLNFGEYEVGRIKVLLSLIMIIFLIVVEWFGRNNEHALSNLGIKQKWIRYALYYFILFLILVYKGSQQQFVYFQF